MARTPTPAASAAASESDTPVIDAAAAAIVAASEQQDPENTAEAGDDRADATIEARVLVDHLGFRANTLALLTEAEAANCEGWADLDPAAVAYVKSLGE